MLEYLLSVANMTKDFLITKIVARNTGHLMFLPVNKEKRHAFWMQSEFV